MTSENTSQAGPGQDPGDVRRQKPPRQCYVALEGECDEGGYWPCLVTEGQPGYGALSGKGACAQPWYWGRTLAECHRQCERMNRADFGLSEREALDILLTSMLASGGLR